MYISVDLDDTLLHTDKSISEYTLKVLHKCQECGHYIIINTARNHMMTKEVMNIVKPDFTSINAGAMICDKNGDILVTNEIPNELTNKLVNRLVPLCEYINIQTRDTLFTSNSNNTYSKAKYLDLNNGCYLDAQKVLPYKLDYLKGKEISQDLGLVLTSYFGGNWSRFTVPKATKLNGLKWIVSNTNGKMSDTISFGDDHGDLEMLLGSYIGVAMKNSQQSLLDVVKYQCDDCDSDGVAKFLVKYFNLNI